MDQEQRSPQKLGGVGAGFILGWLLAFCSAMAQEFMARSFPSDHHMPNFFRGNSEWKVILLLLLVLAALLGGAGGAICGRLAVALVRRGLTGKPLTLGLAVSGAAIGVLMAYPYRVTAETPGVLAIVGSLGALVGVLLARKVLESVLASSA
jgi:formate-dependent nitrite reductase membrane component NrfD